MAEQSSPLLQHGNKDVVFSGSGIKIECCISHKRASMKANGFFASVNQAGIGFALSPNPPIPLENTAKFHYASLHTQFVPISELGFQLEKVPHLVLDDELEIAERLLEEKKKKKNRFKLRIKIGNNHLKNETIAVKKLAKEKGRQTSEICVDQIIEILDKFKQVFGMEVTNVSNNHVKPKTSELQQYN